jgi:hypothetical protein
MQKAARDLPLENTRFLQLDPLSLGRNSQGGCRLDLAAPLGAGSFALGCRKVQIGRPWIRRAAAIATCHNRKSARA